MKALNFFESHTAKECEDMALKQWVRHEVDRPRDSSHEPALIEMLKNDNKRLRNAGYKLAEAALRVTTKYDGVHRLMLAVSNWAKAIADEGGRGD